jgi:hypothetical protein
VTDLRIFGPADDCPHAPSDDPTYQESSLFVWHDLEAGVGGFWRLGQEPVVDALNSCFGIFTHDGLRFRSNVTGVAMAPRDRGETYMGWGDTIRANLDRLAITANFPDCEATLRFEDFHPRYDYLSLVKGPPMPDGTSHHFECAGRMTGQVRIGDRNVTINALGYRDRSWGPRSWGTLRSTRWWPCVFGPDLSAHLLAVVTDEGRYMTFGYVLRDGVPFTMTSSDIVASIDADAISPRSGHACFALDNGETHTLHHACNDGIVMHVRGYTAVESIGTVRWGDRSGISNLEISTNPTGGSKPPVFTLGANNSDGLSVRPRRIK